MMSNVCFLNVSMLNRSPSNSFMPPSFHISRPPLQPPLLPTLPLPSYHLPPPFQSFLYPSTALLTLFPLLNTPVYSSLPL